MEWLNYHHLYYFWRTARCGSITESASELKLSHSTLSVQIRELGEQLGEPLFERRGRRLVLTPFGESVFAYAEDIFRLGGELLDMSRGRGEGEALTPVRVGVVSSMPRSLVYHLVEPALARQRAPLIFRQDNYGRLLEDLSANRVHVILADTHPPEGVSSRLFTHELGASGALLYATPELARAYREGFPRSLEGAPFLLPTSASPLRKQIERWLLKHKLTVRVVCEFDDAGLLRTFGGKGRGVFPVRMALRSEVETLFDCELLGELSGVEESYYAISIERRVKHPFVAALIESARAELRVPWRGSEGTRRPAKGEEAPRKRGARRG